MMRISWVSLFAAAFTVVVPASVAQADTLRDENGLLGGTYLSTDQGLRDLAFTMMRRTEDLGLSAGTIADLRALDVQKLGVKHSATVFVSGYATPGDHSGVNYRYDVGCSDPDTAGTTIVPTAGPGCWRIMYPDPSKVDVRLFGAFPSPTGAPVDALTALNRAASANVPLYFPGSNVTTNGQGAYHISAAWQPAYGLVGDGRSSIKAMTGTWGAGSMLVDIYELADDQQLFSGLGLDCSFLCHHALSTSTASGQTGEHRFSHLNIANALDYAVYFPDTVGSSGMNSVGSFWDQNEIRANGGGLLLHLGVASDDITFVGTRFFIDGQVSETPIILSGFNIHFSTTFYSIFTDFDPSSFTGPRALIELESGGGEYSFNGIFFEGNVAIDDIDYVFAFDGGPRAEISQVVMVTSGGATIRSFARTSIFPTGSGVNGSHTFRGINPGGWTVPVFIEASVAASHLDGASQEYDLWGIDHWTVDTLFHVAQGSTNASTGPFAHISGAMDEVVLDHLASTDGSTVTLVHASPRIAANDNFDLINANGAVWRLTCPFDLTVQKAHSVVNAAPATGDATITMAIEGVNITGGVITIANGSAAGTKDNATPTGASNDNDCDAGETLTLTVGGSSTAGAAGVPVELAPRAA